MPSLYSELDRLQPRLLLLAALEGNGTLSQDAALIRRNVVRLVDKVIFHYSLARQAIQDQTTGSQRSYEEMIEGRVIYMFEFTDHMENCLNATRRVLALLQHLRADLSAPIQNRITHRLIEAHAGSLIDIRNTFEHIENTINKTILVRIRWLFSVSERIKTLCKLVNISLSFSSLVTIPNAVHAEANRLLDETHASSAT